MIKFCLRFYDCSQTVKDSIINPLKELGFEIDDYETLVFATYRGDLVQGLILHDIITRELYLALFSDPRKTLLKIPQERINCVYYL